MVTSFRLDLEAGDPPKLLVRDGWELASAEERLAKALRVRLPVGDVTRDRLLAMRAVFDDHRGDCSVIVHLVIPGESETVMALPDANGVDASDELRRQVLVAHGNHGFFSAFPFCEKRCPRQRTRSTAH